MAEVQLVIDTAALLVGLHDDPGWRSLGNNWRLRTIAECPVGKEDHGGGHLRDTIMVRFNAGVIPNIECGSDLTRDKGLSALDLVYSGTKAHVIRPTKGKALRFRGSGSAAAGIESGEWVFRRSVRHPGSKPNRFPDRALQQAIVMAGGSAFTG